MGESELDRPGPEPDTTLEGCWHAGGLKPSQVPVPDRLGGSYAPGPEGLRRIALGLVLAAHDGDRERAAGLLAGRNKAELCEVIGMLAALACRGVSREAAQDAAWRAAAAGPEARR